MNEWLFLQQNLVFALQTPIHLGDSTVIYSYFAFMQFTPIALQ
jgi:hypothetical protein